jgi:hypothetical protein
MSNFTPSPTIFSYERGQQMFLIGQEPITGGGAAATGNVPQVGNAAPVLANICSIPPTRSNSDFPEEITLQIDATGTLAGTVTLLGSLDNVNFYSLGTFVVAAGVGQIIPNFGVSARYLSASFTGASGTGTVTVSFIV